MELSARAIFNVESYARIICVSTSCLFLSQASTLLRLLGTMDLFHLAFKIRSQVFDPQAFGLENEMGKEMIVEEYSADLQNIVWVLIIWARELEFITK